MTWHPGPERRLDRAERLVQVIISGSWATAVVSVGGNAVGPFLNSGKFVQFVMTRPRRRKEAACPPSLLFGARHLALASAD